MSRELLATGPATLPYATEGGRLVATLTARLKVERPLVRGEAALFPVTAQWRLREPRLEILTLSEALAESSVTLRERIGPEGAVLAIDSWAEAAVFIPSGHRLPGCFVVDRDSLVGPGARGVEVPVEPRSNPDDPDEDLAAALRSFPTTSEGVISVVGPRVVRFDLFPNGWFHSRLRPAAPSGMEAGAGPSSAPDRREAADAFLARVASLPWTRRAAVDLGVDLEARAPGLEGSALFVAGALVHLAVVAIP
jgi:hypothetical protein